MVNFGALSLWQQVKNRPDFVNSFKALAQVITLMGQVNIYERYFAFNIFSNSFGDKDQMKKTVLFGLSDAHFDTVFNDPTYGFAQAATLYPWVLAMNGGAMSQDYQDILSHFQTDLKLADFTPDFMEQVVGTRSMMLQLNYTFSFKMAEFMEYQPPKPVHEVVTQDQWSSRAITSDPEMLLFFTDSDPVIESVYELYAGDGIKFSDKDKLLNQMTMPFGF
mmetsp:Transcript_15641/g.23979  ORF Transcript_15641/g.23979 Transcript_15641/m.23979 type:complete len:220 (+) Transcript_15641:446-1105(+)